MGNHYPIRLHISPFEDPGKGGYMTIENRNKVEKLTMTVEEAGEALGISRATAYMLANTGRIPVIRISDRRLIVPIKALGELLASAIKV
jgi:excisionase family DNA binding protein